MLKTDKGPWLLIIGLAVLAGLLAPQATAGDRLVARLDVPFEVDGQVFASGELSLREVHEYSPVATLQEVRVDGHSLGVLLAQDEPGTPRSGHDELIFTRNDRGHLVLTSMAVKGQPVRKLVRLGSTDAASRTEGSSLVATNR